MITQTVPPLSMMLTSAFAMVVMWLALLIHWIISKEWESRFVLICDLLVTRKHAHNIQGIYIVGTSLLNQPWTSDGYGVLDTTILDAHFGTLQVWRDAITEIHKRGMYVLFDNTIAT